MTQVAIIPESPPIQKGWIISSTFFKENPSVGDDVIIKNNKNLILKAWILHKVNYIIAMIKYILLEEHHVGTTPAWAQTPHVFPVANLMKPLSPQLVPHEFLIFHELSVPTPTKSTAWFIFVPQLDITPPLYALQLDASTVTEIGSELIPDAKPEHPE